jgi:hypothetical protein
MSIQSLDLPKLMSEAVNLGNPKEALQLAISFKEARTREIFEVVSECPDCAFDCLRFVPGSHKVNSVLIAAASNPRRARLILNEFQEISTVSILKTAISGDLRWAKVYKNRFKKIPVWLSDLLEDSKSASKKISQGTSHDRT